jgi:hypothetical protein
MKRGLPVLFLWFSLVLSAQNVTLDFEEFNLPVDTVLNGSDFSGGYTLQDVFFPNGFVSTGYGDFWLSGWSISTMTDSITPGFVNQYSAKKAGGFDDSRTYAVAYDNARIDLGPVLRGNIVEGAYFTNSTYAFNSMRDGDSFAKQFGGDTGTDPDFFFITIKGYSEGQLSEDSIDFYLADYRFEEDSLDYLVDDWEWVDLSALGNVDSLQFSFSSSDTSIFYGAVFLNTPAYFCMDNLVISTVSSQEEPDQGAGISIFPNPASSALQIRSDALQSGTLIRILDNQGRILRTVASTGITTTVPVQDLPAGMYYVHLMMDGQAIVKRWVKQ